MTYKQQVIPTLEMAAPFWASLITRAEVCQLERALHIILGDRYIDYTHALNATNLTSLEDRREKLLNKCALKSYQNPKFNTWFVKNPVPAVPTIFQNSTIPRITHTLNQILADPKTDEQLKCDHCVNTFSATVNLNTHMRYKHQEDHTPKYLQSC